MAVAVGVAVVAPAYSTYYAAPYAYRSYAVAPVVSSYSVGYHGYPYGSYAYGGYGYPYAYSSVLLKK